jgi:biopolymer transport protein ExbB
MIDSIFKFLQTGGPFMIPLGICSIISLTIILERSFALRRSQILSDRMIVLISEMHGGGAYAHIQAAAEEEHSPLGRLTLNCFRQLPFSKYENTESLQTKARSEISLMERGLVVLEIIVGIGPLLGLLGTIAGLITIFGDVSGKGEIATQGAQIAKGIAEALNTTVAGLVVAIPSLIAHSILSKKVESYAVEMENICMELLSKLYTTAK